MQAMCTLNHSGCIVTYFLLEGCCITWLHKEVVDAWFYYFPAKKNKWQSNVSLAASDTLS